MLDGQWFWNNGTNRAWSNYSQCFKDPLVTLLVTVTGSQENNDTLIKVNTPTNDPIRQGLSAVRASKQGRGL